jgi:hypothetical protein
MAVNHDSENAQNSSETPQQPLPGAASNQTPKQKPASRNPLNELLFFVRTRLALWRQKRREREKARLADIVIVAATIVIAIAAVLQWREMHNSGEQTDKIIAADKRIAAAMEGAVAQANNSFNATVEQSHLDQRAWVSVGAVHTINQYGMTLPAPEVGQPLMVRVTFVNTGRTPAINMRWACKDEQTAGKEPRFPSYDYTPAETIPPNGTRICDKIVSSNFSSEEKTEIANGKKWFYLHGQVNYDDIFGRPHWMRYCFFLTSGGAYGICQHHNDIDIELPSRPPN